MTTRGAAERFDADPSTYAEYLRTPLGRLRTELAWRNLEPHLRPAGVPPRALDLGAGTGEIALRLAAAGWAVTLVDGSRRMLDLAAGLAEARGLGARVEYRALDLDAGDVREAVGGGAYDMVVCHDVLEYVASPKALLWAASAALAADGHMSLLIRNRGGEVLKHALRGDRPEGALEILESGRVRESLYGLDVRLFDPGETRALLGAVGLVVVAERGVRVVADHLGDWTTGGKDAFDRMLALELRLGESPELRGIARYVQVIASRGHVSDAP